MTDHRNPDDWKVLFLLELGVLFYDEALGSYSTLCALPKLGGECPRSSIKNGSPCHGFLAI